MRARAQTCPLAAPVRSHALAHHPHIRPATLELLLLRHARTCTVYRDRPTGLPHMHSIFPVHTSGATYKAPGGCWQPFCDPSNPEQSQSTDGSLCGFGGNDAVRNAWRPEDLRTVLDLYAEHSQPYREVRAGSGSPDRINLGSSSANCVDTFPILSPHSCLRLTPPTLPCIYSRLPRSLSLPTQPCHFSHLSRFRLPRSHLPYTSYPAILLLGLQRAGLVEQGMERPPPLHHRSLRRRPEWRSVLDARRGRACAR